MTSSFTPNKSLELPANGDDVNIWDGPVNADFTATDTCFGGVTNLNVVSASGTVALTLTQYRPPIIIISGALTANVTYQLPSGVGGVWAVFNNTTGNFAVIMSSAGGGVSTVLIQGYTTQVICDGTNVGPSTTAPIAPGGLTTQVQYNNGGVLSGSTNLTFNGSTLGLTGTYNQTGNTSQTGNYNLTGALFFLGSSSGYAAFQAAAASTSQTYTLPPNAGSSGQSLTTDGAGNLSWVGAAGGVTSFSAGTTGLTPSTATGGNIVLAGTLAVANGGTGVTASTGTGATVRATSPTLVAPVLGAATVTTINGMTIGTTSGTLILANTSTLATAGSFNTTLTAVGTTNVTLPTSGTLATTGNLSTYAPLASPALTSVPTAPTAAVGTNTTQIATTAFVQAAQPSYAQFRNQQTSGTASGETISGSSWTQRTLNTTVINTISGVALSSNQLTGVPAGTYEVFAYASISEGSGSGGQMGHKIRIRNITDGATVATGIFAEGTAQSTFFEAITGTLQGIFTLSGTKTLELDSWATTNSPAINGGIAASSGDVEVYSDVILRKIA